MLDLPAELPESTRQSYTGYLRGHHLTRELLIAKVRKYLDTISRASHQEQVLDLATSSDLGRGLLRILRDCSDDELCHAQAAAFYFVEGNDAEPDLGSTHGFDDDAAVFNAVCRHLGRDELRVSVQTA